MTTSFGTRSMAATVWSSTWQIYSSGQSSPELKQFLDSRSSGELVRECTSTLSPRLLPSSFNPPSFPPHRHISYRKGSCNSCLMLACYLHATGYFSPSRIEQRIVRPLEDYSDTTLHAGSSDLLTVARNLWNYC